MTEQGPMGILARKSQDWLIEALECVLAEAGLPPRLDGRVTGRN